jgi:predicted TIM-barrel fold metal-dependent hydrolase
VQMMDTASVDKSIVYVDHNKDVHEMVEPFNQRFLLFATLDLKHVKQAVNDLNYCVTSLGFKGVGELFPTGSHFDMNDFAELATFFQKVIDLDVPISWDLKEGARTNIVGGYRSIFSGLDKMQEICYKYPESKHIICHLGGLDNYARTLSTLFYYKNVYFDMAELSSSLIWRFMTPTWIADFGMPRQHGLLLSFLYPDTFPFHLPDHAIVKQKVSEAVINIFREAANVAPDRILFATDAPLVGRMDYEKGLYEKAFGHDKTLLAHIMGENAKSALGI